MTDSDLDALAASPRGGLSDKAKDRVHRAAERLRSDPGLKELFFRLADCLRDMSDMKSLVGKDSELFKELAGPLSEKGKDAVLEIGRALGPGQELFLGMADIALAYAKRGRKPRGPKRATKA